MLFLHIFWQVAELLLSSGEGPNSSTTRRTTPLMLAACRGHTGELLVRPCPSFHLSCFLVALSLSFLSFCWWMAWRSSSSSSSKRGDVVASRAWCLCGREGQKWMDGAVACSVRRQIWSHATAHFPQRWCERQVPTKQNSISLLFSLFFSFLSKGQLQSI